MLKQLVKLPACVVTGLAILASGAARAQDDRWFQVEVLVFTNENTVAPTGAALPEQWDATPVLAYPGASRFLVDPRQVAINSANFDRASLLDDYGRQIISLGTEPAGAYTYQPAQVPQPSGAVATEATAADRTPKPLTPVYEGGAPTPVALAMPRPFVKLPQSYQEFRGKAALMQRRGSHSVLFHETWVQPVPAEDDGLPIILDNSGDTGLWPPLQGSIRIFVSRYLHLETRLWLNTAGNYLPGTWQMPAPPLGPPSLIIEEETEIDIGAPLEAFDAAMTPQADAVNTVGAAGVPIETATQQSMLPVAAGAPADTSAPGAEANAAAEPEQPVYPFRHAVALEQKRRMRSNEAHYIDHPLMGLVIKFTPVSAEQLNEIAGAQQKFLENAQPL